MSDNKSFGMSIDVKSFVRQLLADPSSADQVLEACQEGPADSATEPLGASNLGTLENQDWYTVFMANSKEIPAGEAGHIIRPRSEKTRSRIILNLRGQDNEPKAVSSIGEKLGSPSESMQPPSNAADSGVMSDEHRASLIAHIQAGATQRASKQTDTPEVPAEAAAVLEG